jgi:multiple sugar transport system substrate-binding protein
LALSDSDTRDALKTLATITRDPRLSLSPAEVEQKPAIDWFKEGNLGVLFGTKAIVPQLRSVKGLRFDVAPVPSIKKTATTSEMNAYCIAKTSEHVDAAADFIAFATDGDGVKIASASGAMVPSSLDALHSPEFLAPGSMPTNVALFGEAARKSLPTPYSPYWLTAVASANVVLARVLYGTIDVTSDQTPALDDLLKLTDEASKATFNPPEPTDSPTP